MEEDMLPAPRVANLIRIVRGQRVMMSADLARLYGVAPKVLIQAGERHVGRFPPDFMFRLEAQDVACSRSQIATLKRGAKTARSAPCSTPSGS